MPINPYRLTLGILALAGTVCGAAWLTVSALLWKPGTPRPAPSESAPSSRYDRIAPEPPR